MHNNSVTGPFWSFGNPHTELCFADEVGVMYFIADTVLPVFSSSDMENTAANCPYYSPCVFLPSALAQGEDVSMECA